MRAALPFPRLAVGLVLAASFALPAPASAADADDGLARAAALFKASKKGQCADFAFEDSYLASPEIYKVTYRSDYASAGEPDKSVTIYQFFCDRFAHAGSAVFISDDANNGMKIMSFAFPYIIPDKTKSEDSGSLLVGFGSSDTLQNAEFDPETATLSTTNHVGNTEYFSTYKLRDATFVFEQDGSYKIENGALSAQPNPEQGEE